MFPLQEELGGGGNMPKNDLKVSQMEKICLQYTNLDETGREAWYENEAWRNADCPVLMSRIPGCCLQFHGKDKPDVQPQLPQSTIIQSCF